MNISQNKKVSVVVPNYNYGKYLKKRVDSILKQTYPIYELIILDDASTDGSVELAKNIVLDLKLKNPEMRVKFVGNTENSGKAMAQWKKGFELAEGDFVWIAEADDLCSRHFLEEVMKGFDDPEVVISYAESMVMNGAGIILTPNFRWSRDKEKTGHYKKSYVKEGFREIEEIMAIRCTIPNVSGVVFRKSDKIPYLQYLEEAMRFSQVGDWYFYVKVLAHGRIAYNQKSLNKFRVHHGSKTAESKCDMEHFREILWMHRFFAVKYNLDEFVTKRVVLEEQKVAKRMGINNEIMEGIRQEVAEKGI